MQLKNRIKQNASIDSAGLIVFGAALAGHEAVDLEVAANDNFQYLLEDGTGNYELGVHSQTWNDPTMDTFRTVSQSNVGGGSGFAPSTSGLTLSIVQVASSGIATSADIPDGPRAAGTNAMALGPGAQALKDWSTAIGLSAEAKMTGEIAVGPSGYSYPSWVPVSCFVDTESSDDLQFPAATGYLEIASAMLPNKGVVRITGTIMVSDADAEAAESTQVFDVSLMLTNIGGFLVELGSSAFTPLVTGSTVTEVSFFHSGGRITMSNDDTSVAYIAQGLLHLHWVSADDWW